jgi:hypothetical protein
MCGMLLVQDSMCACVLSKHGMFKVFHKHGM